MGSLDEACIVGFLCRLCSEMHRSVIHIYGDIGLKNSLADKINELLPVTISPTDPLPKTVCAACMAKVLEHYKLFRRIHKSNAIFGSALARINSSSARILNTTQTSNNNETETSDSNEIQNSDNPNTTTPQQLDNSTNQLDNNS